MSDWAASARHAVVVGAGAVGALFAHALAGDGVQVTMLDRTAHPSGPFPVIECDATSLTVRAIAHLDRADIVVMSLPEKVSIAAVSTIASAVRPDALIVDTSSVKTGFADEARRLPPGSAEIVGVNPMFAPSLGFQGRPVAVVSIRPGPRGTGFTDRLRSWGSQVVELTAQEHDALTAQTQALTHLSVLAYALTLARAGTSVGDLVESAPPPCRSLLALAARILGGSPEVYWDIQIQNPGADELRQGLADSLAELSKIIANDDFSAFADLRAELIGYLEPELDTLSDDCAQMFTAQMSSAQPVPGVADPH